MAPNNVYVYKRNGCSHNKIDLSETKSNLVTKANNESKKLEKDNDSITLSEEKHESKALEPVILLLDDDLPNINDRPKRYSKRNFELNKKMETRSMTNFEAIKLNERSVDEKFCNQNSKHPIMNLEEMKNDCKDDKRNITNDVVKAIVQNLLDVAINKNMPRSVECESSRSDEKRCNHKWPLEGDHLDVVMMDSIDIPIKNEDDLCSLKNKTELEREMEIYEAFERDEEARAIIRDAHEVLKEESKVALESSNEKKRNLEGNVYERKKKRLKYEQKLVPKIKNEEDVCFICFDGGDLVLCDRRYV